jgi:ACS family pantothenate transporter-like MFS transporter
MICVCAATLGVTWLVWYLERRDRHLATRTAMNDVAQMREESATPTEHKKTKSH